MNPGQPKGEQPNLNLPEPSLEAPQPSTGPARPEMDYQIPKLTTQTATNVNTVQTTSLSSFVGSDPAGSSSDGTTPKDPALTHLPHVADDLDLMEKEWMVKAKHILAKNRRNPHEQAREIGLLKAAYLKKRFNKEIKIADG